MLSVLLKHSYTNLKRAGGNFGSNGYFYGLDGGDGFIGVQLSPNALSCMYNF